MHEWYNTEAFSSYHDNDVQTWRLISNEYVRTMPLGTSFDVGAEQWTQRSLDGLGGGECSILSYEVTAFTHLAGNGVVPLMWVHDWSLPPGVRVNWVLGGGSTMREHHFLGGPRPSGGLDAFNRDFSVWAEPNELRARPRGAADEYRSGFAFVRPDSVQDTAPVVDGQKVLLYHRQLQRYVRRSDTRLMADADQSRATQFVIARVD